MARKKVPSDPELEAGPFFDALAKDIWALIQEHNLKAEQMRGIGIGMPSYILFEAVSYTHLDVYKRQQRALGHFFTRDNLVALREIALRRTADRVNRTAERERKAAAKEKLPTEEHILICLSSSPSNAKVIRTGARMAEAFHGMFTALFVETPGTRELSGENRMRLRRNLKLAEQLGARISTVYGEDVPAQIAEYAKASGISKIVIGRSNNKRTLFSRIRNPQSLSLIHILFRRLYMELFPYKKEYTGPYSCDYYKHLWGLLHILV